ncbi:MAG: NADPH-dependent FMN reductase [Candidatus Sericytochromatia bacterium]
MKILAVYGSSGQESRSRRLIEVMAQTASAQGAEIWHLDLLTTPLPMFRVDHDFTDDPHVQAVRERCRDADAFMVVSPEYHGCMTGWMKNFFDFHYHEFAGKLFALAATTGGSLGVSCNTQMRVAVQHCHGWALPYQTALRETDFDATGAILSASGQDRLQRMGRDLVVYGRLLRSQFQQDQHLSTETPPQPTQAGFAGWYRG